ncbi:MAG: hypothetical protein JOS17DRAFT_42306 [Linnemannia elongata]|nr:MAG: hypothetical protein JOS17DRAFT_42306 [Linnemannia elongata]
MHTRHYLSFFLPPFPEIGCPNILRGPVNHQKKGSLLLKAKESLFQCPPRPLPTPFFNKRLGVMKGILSYFCFFFPLSVWVMLVVVVVLLALFLLLAFFLCFVVSIALHK